uniref:Retrotransposon protein, putative, Ty1-copia subclass n=1 Tax=Tanacetum cinerariifolium TaxID=118510 RepID=A0A6L2J9G5_TANCI|nr:hypothetical protein [Tanacetum cinerariifolium]
MLAKRKKPKIPPPPKREHLKKDSICHHCKEVGHWRRNYTSYHAELKKRKNASVASTSGVLFQFLIWLITHDGLLQPTYDESHEKCKSCISKKMAQKPFPHQMERAKDLSGLIHTDVCGPFRIVSREGANYFITFTDDFSRYGFVYLMKLKHEVFETFKGYALETAALIFNMVPTKKVDRTPYEIWHVPNRYGYYVDIEEYELGDVNEPPYYKVALADPESKKWLEAMNTKMQSMKDNQVCVAMLQEVKSWLCKCFSMKNIGEATYLLGIKIIRDKSKRLIALSQSSFLKKILKKFRMENSKKGYTLIMEKPGYRMSQCAKTPTEKSANQSTTAMSSTEAEYIAAAEASMEAIRMRKFIDGVGGNIPSNKRPMEMLCENKHALAIAGDLRILKGARHFQRKYHYIREVIQRGEIILKKVHTDDNVVDPFTKPMPLNKHFEHAMATGIVPASNLM